MCSGPVVALGKQPRAKLGPYLAGLIEGDGSIYTPKKSHTPKGTKNYGMIYSLCYS